MRDAALLPIANDAEFDALMEELDAACQKRGEQIIGRELRLWLEFCRKLRARILSNVCRAAPAQSNVYTVFNFGNHIDQWVQRRYGSRLGFDPAWGYFAILLRGDAWLVTVPMIVGNVTLTAIPDMDIPLNPSVLNLLKMIKGLTPELAKRLTADEVQQIRDMFLVHFDVHNLLIRAGVASDSLGGIALLDLTSAAKRVVADRRQLGTARFEALQAAEKFLKHFLRCSGQGVEQHHKLRKLREQAATCGLSGVRDEWINQAQTTGGSRYGERTETVEDVVKALEAAARIGRQVAVHLYAKDTQTTVVSSN
jgi:hypothetical protein